MARLIDANKLVLRFEYGIQEDGLLFVPFRDVQKSVKLAPTVDAVPVVRCKDCEYSNKALYGWLWCTAGPCEGKVVLEDFYCKCGEMRKDNENR